MKTSTRIKIAFLLGSGISNHAKIPSIQDITKRVLSGKGFERHTDGNYYLTNNSLTPDEDEYISRIIVFLKQLKKEIDHYYSCQVDRCTNYEDLYYVTEQIQHSELREYDNPAIQPFIDKILPEIRPLLVGNEYEVREKWELRELATEATCYIRDVVWHLLSKQPNNLAYLTSFKDACIDDQLTNVDIFTLNHDTVMEQYLSSNNIKVTDGFGKSQNNVRYWKPELFEREGSKVRLFKLHGSVNWFTFRPDDGNSYSESIGIPLDWDIWDTRNIHGQRQRPIGSRPMFLAGTFNKMLDYTSSIYTELYYHFYNTLKKAEKLIICGYGFGDKGINRQIFEWVYSSPKHKFIIIHKDTEGLKKIARPVLRNNWDDLTKQKKLQLISKWIENTTWQDIKNVIF